MYIYSYKNCTMNHGMNEERKEHLTTYFYMFVRYYMYYKVCTILYMLIKNIYRMMKTAVILIFLVVRCLRNIPYIEVSIRNKAIDK